MMNKMKYEQMLEELAKEYPALKDDVDALSEGLAVEAGEEDPMADDEAELELPLDEEEDAEFPMPKKKPAVPAEEEEEEEDELF